MSTTSSLREPTGQEPWTPLKLKATSATERGQFRECRRKWFLSIAHHLQPLEGNQNFWLGTLVHAGLETYYKTLMARNWRSSLSPRARDAIHYDAVGFALDDYQVAYEASIIPLQERLGFLWSSVEPTYMELGELGFEMLVAYFDRERLDPIFDEIVDVEHRLFIPIRNPSGRKVGTLTVMTDLVGRRAGMLGVADHKTASREMSLSQLDLDDQLTAEVFAVYEALKEFPEEAVYNVLMKKVPKPPKRNKDGKPKVKGGPPTPKLSMDKSQPTTYDLYMQSIRELGLDVADYQEFLDFLQEKEASGESDFFRRDRVLRSPAQIAQFEANLFEEWRDIKAVAAHPERAYPSPSAFRCPSCPVKLICTTMMDDGDVEAIIKASYIIAEDRY